MGVLIDKDLEFYEVLNAFPILKEKLQQLDFDVSKLNEGESIRDFLVRMSLSDYEIDLIIKKLNFEVKYFLKNGELCGSKKILQDESCVLKLEEEEEE
jgi:hypothetical protein